MPFSTIDVPLDPDIRSGVDENMKFILRLQRLECSDEGLDKRIHILYTCDSDRNNILDVSFVFMI